MGSIFVDLLFQPSSELRSFTRMLLSDVFEYLLAEISPMIAITL